MLDYYDYDYKTPKIRIEKKRKGKEFKPYSSKHVRQIEKLQNKKRKN